MPTDTSEKGLETLICDALVNGVDYASDGRIISDRPAVYSPGWILGDANDYDRDYCVDLKQLSAFLHATQPVTAEALSLEYDNHARRQFLARLSGEVAKRGVVAVLRNGVKDYPHSIDLFYASPSPNNETAKLRHGQNRFSVTRQLRYSKDNKQLALDLCLFINGLPVVTFELKNSLTKQTAADAVEQYKRDRDPREPLFQLGRCLVHFAMDENEVQFCTHLNGKGSWFLPFNRGWDDGAGNPPNPNGLKTDYMWREILTRKSLTNIIENYAQLLKADKAAGRQRSEQLWPRYHQLDVVRKLLAHASEHGVGQRYLIQHSAGSGKSNSIAWLAHQLIGIHDADRTLFDTVVVVTDRKILDQQINDTIKQFAQVSSIVQGADSSADLRSLLREGKRIIISTIQKFPHILDSIGEEHRRRSFATIIDEAHSSQGGRNATAMAGALSENGAEGDDDDYTVEDEINRLMESRKMLANASYFAFTATPKNKTLELFGSEAPGTGGKRIPFHVYTMKQAIQEGFIIDVLSHYTPVESYYRLIKTVADDPEFDAKRASAKLRRYVEDHNYAIRQKAAIAVDHFHEQVFQKQKIAGKARAMLVASSVDRAIRYFYAIEAYLRERNSPYQAIVAFSGERDFDGKTVTEASVNGFASNMIAQMIQQDPYRILVCADKFQTGYDEPLLHTMYVDKPLSGVKAVQTLSRLNRAHQDKHDAFILDFANDADSIQEAFSDYYRTTILAEESDPNRLHDLNAILDGHQVYTDEQIDRFVELFLTGSQRESLDPILDKCVATYLEELNEDGQVEFKGTAKTFLRTYEFLGAILLLTNQDWEKLSIFLHFLVPKLPAPIEDDHSRGIIETIDMDSYRVEKLEVQKISLHDSDAEIDPTPLGGGGKQSELELDLLSNILQEFNDLWGNIEWQDRDKIVKVIAEELPAMVGANEAYKNAMANSDRQNARIEHDKALELQLISLLATHADLYKQYSDNTSFNRWLSDKIFDATYAQPDSQVPTIVH